MSIWQRSNQAFSPLLCQARLSHQHPAWHIVDCQQIYVIVLKSLDTLLKPGDVVSDAFSSFPLELFEAKNISRLLPFFCGRCCPSSASSLVIKASMPRRSLSALRSKLSVMFSRCGQLLLVGHRKTNSSCCSSNSSNQSLQLMVVTPATGSPSQCGRCNRSDLGSISPSP